MSNFSFRSQNQYLKPIHDTSEAKRIGKLGGIASGQARRNKRALAITQRLIQKRLQDCLALKAPTVLKHKIIEMFPELQNQEIDLLTLFCIAPIQAVIQDKRNAIAYFSMIKELLNTNIDNKNATESKH